MIFRPFKIFRKTWKNCAYSWFRKTGKIIIIINYYKIIIIAYSFKLWKGDIVHQGSFTWGQIFTELMLFWLGPKSVVVSQHPCTPTLTHTVSLEGDTKRLNKLIMKAGYALAVTLDTVEKVANRRMRTKLLDGMDNLFHPLHDTVAEQRSSFSNRLLLQLRCTKEHYRRSFLPAAIRLYNSSFTITLYNSSSGWLHRGDQSGWGMLNQTGLFSLYVSVYLFYSIVTLFSCSCYASGCNIVIPLQRLIKYPSIYLFITHTRTQACAHTYTCTQACAHAHTLTQTHTHTHPWHCMDT